MNVESSPISVIKSHKSLLPYQNILGTYGFSLPDQGILQPLMCTENNIDVFRKLGITFEVEQGSDNVIWLDKSIGNNDLVVRVRNCSNTLIILGSGSPIAGRLAFTGSGCIFSSAGFGRMGDITRLNVVCTNGGAAVFGKNCTSVQSNWLVEGNQKALIVGDDLMASWNVTVRNYDSHSIFDIDTLNINNSALDTVIGPHVWLGMGSNILRGVRVGCGSIIGANSSVFTDVGDFSVAVGSPAKIVKSKTSWARQSVATKEQMESVIAKWSNISLVSSAQS